MNARLIHPLTGTDYSVPLYISPSGRKFYPIGGGSEPMPEPTPPAPTPTPEPTPTPTPPVPTPPAPEPTPAPSDDLPEDRDALVKMIGDLRKENASTRTTAKKQAADEARAELAQSIGKAIGLVKDDEPVDPAELAKQIEQSKTSERTAQIHLAVFKTAGKHLGDPEALLDSSSFLAKLSDLDPNASDFDTKVGEVIKTAVDANPKLKSSSTPGSSSVDHPGGGGAPKRTEAKSMVDAVNATLGT